MPPRRNGMQLQGAASPIWGWSRVSMRARVHMHVYTCASPIAVCIFACARADFAGRHSRASLKGCTFAPAYLHEGLFPQRSQLALCRIVEVEQVHAFKLQQNKQIPVRLSSLNKTKTKRAPLDKKCKGIAGLLHQNPPPSNEA